MVGITSSGWSWFTKIFEWKKSVKLQRKSRVGAEASAEDACQDLPRVRGNAQLLRVVALCGSLRKASYSRGLIRAAMEIARESVPGLEIELVDVSDLPFLNTDLEVDGRFPEVVEAFRKRFVDADCILFSTPEYNYSISGVLQNAIDWASRSPNVMAGRPAAILSVGGLLGGARAQYHLRQMGVGLDLHFVNKPEVFVSGSQPPKKFDEDGNLIDEEIRKRVKRLLLALQAFAIKLLN